MSTPAPRRCFVVMPFKSEFNYFYLYLQRYLAERHALVVERGDHRVLTIPLLEKIRNHIEGADFIIGDITGRNPNVFYELGMADASGKPVILITQDPSEEVPSDIRHLEFIRYDLGRHLDFLPRLDNAIQNLFRSRYSMLFSEAQHLLELCNEGTGAKLKPASEEVFLDRVVAVESIQGIPGADDPKSRAEFLLARIVRDTADMSVMQVLTGWISLTFFVRKTRGRKR